MKKRMTNLGAPLQAAVALALLGSLTAYAAKNPDKPSNPDKRAEKIERKLERAAASFPAVPEPRKVTAAPAPAPQPQADRSSRSNRSRSTEYREPTTPADSKFDSFRVIVEKNIFNPTRIGRTRDRSEERAPRTDTIALVGTMQSDKGVMAFFDSPDPAYRKALREGGAVGDFKVQKIKPDEVELLRDGKPLSLHVAQQLRRPEGGEWSVSAVETPRADAGGGTAATAARPTEPAEPPPIPPDASDVVRRMMEQRQKQLKN